MTLPKIYGMNESSEMGINIFAPSIFLGGCNLRCPYCMNYKLLDKTNLTEIPLSKIKEYIIDNNCKWINVSGGEPTCVGDDKLKNLLTELKGWNCKIGMATNGTKSKTLKEIISLLDYVALDIKTTDHSIYESLNRGQSSFLIDVLTSQTILAEEKNARKKFDYEIRTTLFPPFINKKTLKDIGSIIRKKDKWVLQKFRNNVETLYGCKDIVPYNDKEVSDLLKIAKRITKNAVLREI